MFYSQYLTKSLATRLMCLLLLASGLFCLVSTGSRTGYAAMLILPLAYYAFNMTSVRTMIFVLATYAMFFVMVQYLLPPDFVTYNIDSLQIETVDPKNVAVGATLGRINLTERLLEIAREHPYFGLGPGFVPRMDIAGDPRFVGLGGSENQYAMLLVETGVVGVIGYAIFVFSVLRLLVTASKHNHPAKVQWASISGSILLSILVAAVAVTVIASIVMMLIMTYLGMAVVFAKEGTGRLQTPNPATPLNGVTRGRRPLRYRSSVNSYLYCGATVTSASDNLLP
jgi:O-antigen ligase